MYVGIRLVLQLLDGLMERKDHFLLNCIVLLIYRSLPTMFYTSVLLTIIGSLEFILTIPTTNSSSSLSTTDTSLYVANVGDSRVLKLSLNGTEATTAVDLTAFCKPFYLYVDDQTNIFVSCVHTHEVLVFRPNSTNGTRIAGTGVSGFNDNQLNRPYGLFGTDDKAIYIADWLNHRIMKWSEGATSGIRVAGFDSTQLDHPAQVLIDRNGYMYISDDRNHRIVRWPPDSAFGECIVACTGVRGTAPTQLYRPHSLGFDSNASLYVNDYENHRVQKFQILNYYSEYSICSHYLATNPDFSVSDLYEKREIFARYE